MNLFQQILISPADVKTLSDKQWSDLLRLAKSASMLSRLYQVISSAGYSNAVPEKFCHHVSSEHVLLKFQHVQVAYEMRNVAITLNKLGIIPIFLKGAAYQLGQHTVAKHRLFSDIDILINKDDIPRAERLLKCDGWISQNTNDYDQQYYRQYMHEIPPIQHYERGTVIDLHHNILPICHENAINISDFTLNSTTIENKHYRCKILSPAAMFLHSAIHLFHEGEFEKGLRGLSDLDLLYQEFSKADAQFCQQVIALAKKTKQQQALYLAWNFCEKMLNTPLSPDAKAFINGYKKADKLIRLYDFIYTQVLSPHHELLSNNTFRLAALLGYLRGHLLRMPLRLLIPHLLTKTWRAYCSAVKPSSSTMSKVSNINNK